MADDKLVLVNQTNIGKELMRWKSAIEQALPRHITPERMARIALTALRTNPKLAECTFQSFIGAVLTASQLGLEPFVNGQCFLVPYKNGRTGLYNVQMIPGWRGYLDLILRTKAAIADTKSVYDGDEFEYEYGTNAEIHHKPGRWSGKPEAMTHTYAIGRIKGMEDYPVFNVWEVKKIWDHRDKNNRCFDKNDHYSFKFPEQYALKCPLMQTMKMLPSSVEMHQASELDIAGSEGRQNLTIDMSLTTGSDTDKEIEIEQLMSRLNWDDNKRKAARESYLDRTDELLDYLRKQAAPITTGQKPMASTSAAQTQAASGDAIKKKSGSKAKAEPAETRAEKQSEPGPEEAADRSEENVSQAQNDGQPELFTGKFPTF